MDIRTFLSIGASLLCLCANASEPDAADLAERAKAAIEAGDLAGGLRDLRQALQLADVAPANLLNADKPVITAQALAHGKEQFQRLAGDRPAIVQFDRAKDFSKLRDWAIRRFAGEGTELRIYWDEATPLGTAFGSTAEHSFPIPGSPVYIRLAKTVPNLEPAAVQQQMPFERLWNGLVFEFLNLTYWTRREELRKLAVEGDISKAEFVTEFFYTEYRAIRDTHLFYCDLYLPWAIEAGLQSNPHHWDVDKTWWMSPEEVLDRYPFSGEYPWGLYGKTFELVRREPNAKPRKAKQLNDRSRMSIGKGEK